MFKQEGVFAGTFKDASLGMSKSELPMFVAILQPDGIVEDGELKDFDSTEAIPARLCLYSKAGAPIFHCENLTRAFGWKTLSINKLMNVKAEKLPRVIFKVENEPYVKVGETEPTDSYKVTSILHIDERPGLNIKKATAAEAAIMSKKFKDFTAPKTAGNRAAAPPARPTAAAKKTAAPKADPAGKAWDVFTGGNRDLNEDALDKAWWALLTEAVGHTDTEKMGTDDWNKVFKALDVPF